jgi:hypothetical protein
MHHPYGDPAPDRGHRPTNKMLSTKNFAVIVIIAEKTRVTEKLRGDQNMIIITFAALIIFLDPVGLSALARSHCCSE